MVWKQPHESQPREVSYFAKQWKNRKGDNNDLLLISSVEEKLFSITFDSQLEKHITGTCHKAIKKYMFCPELQATCRWINEDFS